MIKTDNKFWIIPDAYSKSYQTKEQVCSTFLSTVCAFFNINITPKELEFLAFVLSRGTTVGQVEKRLYIDRYRTSAQVVDNLICSLKKKRVLMVDTDKKIKLHKNIGIKMTGDNYIFQFRCRKQTEKIGDTNQYQNQE